MIAPRFPLLALLLSLALPATGFSANIVTEGIWKNKKRVVLPDDRPPNRCDLYYMVKFEQHADLEKLFAERRAHKLEFYSGWHPLYGLYGEMDGFGEPFSDEQWEEHFAKLDAWSRACPDSPSPLVAKAEALMTYAWAARGTSYGRPRTPEGDALFLARMRRAREALLAAEKCSVQESTIYRAHLAVATWLALPRAEVGRLLRRGLEICPADQKVYEAAAHYLSPMREGGPGEWEAFATREADKVGGENGDILYMALVRSMSSYYRADLFTRSAASWERMRRGFAAACRRAPDYVWDVHSYCYFACIAGDRATAQALFKHIGDRREREVWGDDATFEQWRQWAAAASS